MAKRKRPQHITFDDLVSVDGYEGRLFYVDCWTVEHVYFPSETFTEVWYDLTDAHTGEYQMAEAEDMTKVCDAAKAEEYLNAGSPPPAETKPNAFDNIIGKGVAQMYGFGGGYSKKPDKPERKPTARELSAQEAERRKQARKEKAVKIDALLDEYNDYKRMAAEFGDEEYRARVEYLTVKLAEISSEE